MLKCAMLGACTVSESLTELYPFVRAGSLIIG